MSVDPFFLYLRSFTGDKATRERWTISEAGHKSGQEGTPKVIIEHLLKAAGPLIEIGGKSHLGLGRVQVSGNDWWNDAVTLIIHSTAIFISPNMTRSLINEIDFIFSNNKLLRRAFVIMEPTHENMRSDDYHGGIVEQRRRRWEATRTLFAARDVSLTKYENCGGIVSLYDSRKHVAFTNITRYRLYDLLQTMGVDLTRMGSYDINQDEVCPCHSRLKFGQCHGRSCN